MEEACERYVGYSGCQHSETATKMHCRLADCCSVVLARNWSGGSTVYHYLQTVGELSFELSYECFYHRLVDDSVTLLFVQVCDPLYLATDGTDLEPDEFAVDSLESNSDSPV